MARLEVGRIARAHGLRGDVVIAPITDLDARFAVGSTLYDGDTPMEIVASRVQADRFVVRFAGIDDRSAAESLRGHLLHADQVAADDGTIFVHDLVSSRVLDQHGRDLGVVTHVEANPAHDIMVCDTGMLIPVVFLRDHGGGVIHTDLPDGLVELYLES